MNDGIIRIDTGFAKEIGFTSDKFRSTSYLWKKGKELWISMIIALFPNQGAVQELFNTILKKGYHLRVPTPIGSMKHIVKKMGLIQTYEYDEYTNSTIEVWLKD